MALESLVVDNTSEITPLRGVISIDGSKNAALTLLPAALLSDTPCVLGNIPHLKDITTMIQLMSSIGASFTMDNLGRLTIDQGKIFTFKAEYKLVKSMRASILLLGPLLTKFGQAEISMPGGCAIGTRPVDIHIDSLRQMGAVIDIEDGYIKAKAPHGLHGAEIIMKKVTVTGTENILMAATLAHGRTVIRNAATEPEVDDLIHFLNRCGAKIERQEDQTTIVIDGVSTLPGGIEHTTIFDRIEAGTYLIAAAMTKGSITLEHVAPQYMHDLIVKLKKCGAEVVMTKNTISLSMRSTPKVVNIKTAPYPGFPTDLQAQWMALMCLAEGKSAISEEIFENRYMHVAELQRMGANIKYEDHRAIIVGGQTLRAAPIMATDLRASASLVLAALCALGKTVISRIYHIDRGYPNVEEKLRLLGANVYRVSDPEAQA